MPTQHLPMLSRMRFGIIDEAYMNTLATRANEFADIEQSLNRLINARGGTFPTHTLAVITAVESIATAVTFGGAEVDIAWRYGWEVRMLGDGATSFPATEDDGYSSSGIADVSDDEDAGFAFNLAELTNIETSPVIFGVDISGEDYPEGYAPVGLAAGAVVLLRAWQDETGRLVYITDRMGTHDGTCSE